MKKYLSYINERFPLPGVTLYAGSMYWVAYSFVNLFAQKKNWVASEAILGFFIYFLVILHLRLFDEHKDFDKDKKAYPERMLSRGDITLGDLRKLLFPVLVIEAVISMYLGVVQFAVWLLILVWTLLMLKEFFAQEFLNKRIGLYLLSHQLLVPVMVLFPLSQRMDGVCIGQHEISRIILLSAAVMCMTITYEIGRKTWSADRENEFADSYTKAWGVKLTVMLTIGIALTGTCIFCWLMSEAEIPVIYILINGILFSIFSALELVFYFNQTNRNSKLVEMAGAVFMLGTFINSSIAFTLY